MYISILSVKVKITRFCLGEYTTLCMISHG